MDTAGREIIDSLLTTTRTVRRRLDFDRPVSNALILECLDLALQAPTGGNYQGWRWIVVRDESKKRALAGCYRQALAAASEHPPEQGDHGASRMLEGAWHLADHLHEVPVLVIPCILGRLKPSSSSARAASLYGSIYPAVWSFQLALRSRGLGSAFTTIHLENEAEVARLLHVPERVTQAALIPVAHVLGDTFRPAERLPARQVTYWDTWDVVLEEPDS
jgi:nitroreductase